MKNPKFSLGIRIVAGCYLIYLAYQITKGGLLGKENLHGWQFAVALIGVIVFVVVGVVIAYQSSKALMEMQREEKLKAAEEAAEQAAQDAMWQQQSSDKLSGGVVTGIPPMRSVPPRLRRKAVHVLIQKY